MITPKLDRAGKTSLEAAALTATITDELCTIVHAFANQFESLNNHGRIGMEVMQLVQSRFQLVLHPKKTTQRTPNTQYGEELTSTSRENVL